MKGNTSMLLNDRKISFIKQVWLVLCLLLVLVGIPFPQTTAMAASGTYQYTSATNPVSAADATTDDGSYRYITDIDLEDDGDRDFIGYYDTTDDGEYNGSFYFFVNNGSGSFSRVEPAGITLPLTNGSNYLCTDFDNDGDDDIFAVDPNAPGAGAYYTNNGSGIFTSAANPLAAAGALTDNGDIFIIDIDLEGDGDRDFIAYYNAAGYHEELNNDIYNGSFDFFVNNGSGSFSRVEPAGITLPLQTGDNYICADFDNDGDEDIYAPGGYFTNNGSGNFTSATNPISAAGATTDDGSNRYISDIDLDSDGDIDFIAYDGSIFAFYMNNGSGSFTKEMPADVLPLTNATEYLSTDFDNDGDEDIFAPGAYFTQGGTSAGTNNRPPRKSTTSPADNATGMSPTENISITFDETITDGGSGRINIYQSVGDALVESIPGNDARVSGFGTSTITINPNATFSGNTQYYVIVEVGALFDDDGMTFAGIVTNTEFNFEAGIPDSTAPTVDTNTGLTLDEGATAYLTSGVLDSSDNTDGASGITYTVTSGPTNGSLSHSTFTQAQLDLGNVVSYTHNDSNTTSDSFGFKVADSTGNEVGGQTFSITVNAVDDEAPTVSITTTESDPTNSSPFSVTFTFNEDVSGFTQGDIMVGNGNTSNFVNTVANRVWTADIAPLGDGTVTVDVNSGVCTDAAGNGNTAAAQFSNDYDGTAPSTWITSSEGDPTNNSPFSVTFTFNEDVSGFTVGDITVGNGNASNFTNTVANRVWTADIAPLGDGTVTVDVNSGVCTDAAGNGNTAATQFSVDFDTTAPNALITSSESDPTNNSPFTVTFTFNEDVSGFTVGDIAVGNGNASNFTITVPNRVWTADITPIGNGTVTVDVNSGACTDAVGNGNTAAAQFSIDYDATAPTVMVNTGLIANEGATETITIMQLSATDTEANDALLVYTVTDLPDNGVLSSNGSTLLLNGTFTQQDIIDGEIRYVHNGSETTSDSFVFKVADNAQNVLTGQTFNITVTPVNDDPTIWMLPYGIMVYEDTASNVDLSAATISDADSGSSSIMLNITASAGTFSATSGGGVTVGGAGTSTLTLYGTVANIDSYLNTASNIRYTGAANANGNDAATLTLSANDGGNTGTGGGTNVNLGTINVDIAAVNDDPTIWMLPYGIMVYEDTASNVDLSAATFYDVDAGAGSIMLNITASAGTLLATSGGGVTISGSDTSTLTLYGTVANIDTYLNTASNIRYTGAANANGNDAATLTLTANDGGNTGTGGGTNVNLGTVNVDIAAVNDAPTIVTNTGLTLNEGATKRITIVELKATDVDTDDATLLYTVTASPVNGQLENTDNPGVSISSFTQQNILDGKIQYVHDGSNSTSDSFTFKVSDSEGGELTGQTFSITVNAIDDDAPTMVNNMGLILDEGAVKTIATAELLATDTETADASIVYTVMDLPDNGELSRDGLALSLSGTFTQQDIIDGKIQYAHDGSTTASDSFDFKAADSNANELCGQTFSITINLAPVPTITPSPTQTPGEDTRTIRGTLLDEEGNPKVGYVVELHSTPITAITDSQGRYRFDNVDYTAHTLFVKTPAGQQITSFALSFDEGEEFEKSVTGEGADITYTKSTVSVDITIALDGDEDNAEITVLSGVDNPATGRTHIWWILILAAILAAGLIGLIVKKRDSTRL